MRILLSVLILTSLFVPTPRTEAAESAPPWTRYARDLFTGDEKKATVSKEWFSSHPQALKDLARQMDDPEQKHLALDTLVTLGRVEIVPLLLENLVTSTDGSYALALSALMNKENAQLILGRFRRLLESDSGAALPFTLVLPVLDTLGRLQVPLSTEAFKRLAAGYGPEVRLALANYLRNNANTFPHPYPEWLYEILLTDRVYQVRLAALSLHKEFPQQFKEEPARKACQIEKHSLLRLFCQRILSPESSP